MADNPEEIPLSNDVALEEGEKLIEPQKSQPTEIHPSELPEEDRKKYLQTYLDVTKSLEHAPPEGRSLFFEDGERRIDFVLVWEQKKEGRREYLSEQYRRVFMKNLEDEGLQLEIDLNDDNPLKYLKIHAPWEVLTRYSEIIKMRMPMKEVPEEVQTASLWEFMSDMVSKLFTPFEHDIEEVPPVPKKFTGVFQRDKEYLFAIPEKKELFFSHSQRSRIVDYILRRKKYSDDPNDSYSFGIKQLLSNGAYSAAYPLHEGTWKPTGRKNMRNLLYTHWASWKNFYKVQPLDYVRTYFGEKVGLYFAWLGFYTYMLFPASLIGLGVFIYGLVTMSTNTVAQETCNMGDDIFMCPLCDKRCNYWKLSAGCYHVQASHLFDNAATVFFAIFMSFWGTAFLEFWKREQAVIQFKWNLLNFEQEEEPPRPEYLAKLTGSRYKKRHTVTGIEEPYVPFWKKRVPLFVLSFSVILFLMLMAVSVVMGVIIYRMTVLTALYLQNRPLLYRNATLVTSATAALINLVVIFILNFVYGKVAVKLTDMECLRTQTEYDGSLSFKLYCLQFVNYYSSIFYVAFFKGKFVGYPGGYNTFMGARQEECQPGGCLIELCLQLAIIMVGKQLLQNTILEFFLPRIKIGLKKLFREKVKKAKMGHKKPWEKDFKLEEMGPQGIFYEYLEMLLQFGFVTIFVAAFPLAPLFAWINNMLEIRSDANKFITQLRRPMAARAQDIGVWYNVLYAIARIAIITNALIIALTSNFIPRLVYVMSYSPKGNLEGFVNNSLSYFNVKDFQEHNRPEFSNATQNITICRYRDYRFPPWSQKPYSYTPEYWHVLAARFIFVFIFENVVILLTGLMAKLIPDMPRKVREQHRREAYLTNEIILKVELDLAKGGQGDLTAEEINTLRRRARVSIYNRAMSEPAKGSTSDLVVHEEDPAKDAAGELNV